MKTCQNCGLYNPDTAQRCDCGFDFASGKLAASYLDTSNIDTLTTMNVLNLSAGHQLKSQLEQGLRYVAFQYCVSIGFMTFKRTSRVYTLGPHDNRFLLGFRYSLVSLLFGWWGIPWGPIWTIETIIANCRGGKDITHQMIATIVPRTK